MTPIELLAFIFALAVLLKIAFVFLNPKSWLNITEKLLKSSVLFTVIYVILAVVVAFYIFQALTIVQVAAVMLFTALLGGIAFLPHAKEMLDLAKSLLKKNHHVKKNWLSILIWTLLAIWVLSTLFA